MKSKLTVLPDAQRSRTMRAVKSKDTKPEMLVRRLIHSMGLRYRLHGKKLPGCPDLVFGPSKKVIFVHGCFWHGHDCKRGCRVPKTNADYWIEKVNQNRKRDKGMMASLERAGWRSLTVWECEIKEQEALKERIRNFLQSPKADKSSKE